MLNCATIMGRLTKDPELKATTGTGTNVCTFTVACDRDVKDETDFFTIVAWNKTAEYVCNYLEKGSMVSVKGRLQNRSWTDKDGNKHNTTEISADSVYGWGGKKKDREVTPTNVPATGFGDVTDADGELPF